MGFCDVKAHAGHHFPAKWFADIINHRGMSSWGWVYIGVLRASAANHCVSKKSQDSSKWSKDKFIQCILTVWRQGFHTGNLKTDESYVNTEKRRWDGSLLIGDPALNGLRVALRLPCRRKVEWSSIPQTLKYSLIIKTWILGIPHSDKSCMCVYVCV